MCVRRLVNVWAIFLRPSGARYVLNSCPTARAVGYLLTALRACQVRKRAHSRTQDRQRGNQPQVLDDPAHFGAAEQRQTVSPRRQPWGSVRKKTKPRQERKKTFLNLCVHSHKYLSSYLISCFFKNAMSSSLNETLR